HGRRQSRQRTPRQLHHDVRPAAAEPRYAPARERRESQRPRAFRQAGAAPLASATDPAPVRQLTCVGRSALRVGLENAQGTTKGGPESPPSSSAYPARATSALPPPRTSDAGPASAGRGR